MKSKSTLKRLAWYLKEYRLPIIYCIILSALFVALNLIGPILIGKAIDNMTGKGSVDFKGVLQIVIGLTFIFLLAGISQTALNRISAKISYKIVQRMRNQAFEKITAAPVSFADNNSHGVIISKIIGDTEIISDGLLISSVHLFTSVLTVIATLAIMFYLNYIIALAVLILTPLSLFSAAFITKKAYTLFRQQAELQGELYGHLSEMISGQKVVKAYAQEQNSVNKFSKINGQLNKVGTNAQFYGSITNPSTRFVNGLVYIAVGIIGGIFCIKSGNTGMFTVGILSVFLSYANQYTKPFNEVTEIMTQISSAVSSAARVFDIIDTKKEPLGIGQLLPEKIGGAIEFKNVSFSYNDERKFIENLNFTAAKGEKIAIVGPTGCGKTTIINLLMRFYDTCGGEILLDGKNISDLDLDDYRGKFGMVLQDTFISNDTVFNNIAYGRENATMQEVVEAAKAAQCDHFINNLADGYNTVIDGSVNISQGESQLICIARLMLTNPQILILDEATSSLDIVTEQYVEQGFSKIMQGRTSFIVAHRLSTIKAADKILVMRDGGIVEQGTHEQLLAQKGFYFELYNSQFDE